MRCRLIFASVAVCLSLAAPLAFAQQFSSLEERMSSSEFKAAGLDKLSPEELARLNAFVKGEVEKKTMQARETVVREQEQTAAARMGFKDYQGENEEIVSTIPGVFKGWVTGTEFTLENGQVWRVSESDAEFTVKVTNAVAHISPGFLGTWNFHIEGYGSSAKVERIK